MRLAVPPRLAPLVLALGCAPPPPDCPAYSGFNVDEGSVRWFQTGASVHEQMAVVRRTPTDESVEVDVTYSDVTGFGTYLTYTRYRCALEGVFALDGVVAVDEAFRYTWDYGPDGALVLPAVLEGRGQSWGGDVTATFEYAGADAFETEVSAKASAWDIVELELPAGPFQAMEVFRPGQLQYLHEELGLIGWQPTVGDPTELAPAPE